MALAIRKVKLHVKENNKEHHTDDISVKRLLLRRGQSFQLTLHTSRQFQPDTDTLLFTVETGPFPSEAKGTRCVFGYPKSTGVKGAWTAKVQESGPSSVTLALSSPADASVGSHKLSMRVGSQYAVPQPITDLVLLFNPWCAEDWVHLPDEAERQEYVMSEQGIIYRGSTNHISPMAWNFGQFEEDVVDICIKLLDMNPKCLRDAAEDVSARCNPIYVGRVVSAMINANDDYGVVAGRWQSPYPWPGVAPTHWNGSVEILRRWSKSRCSPVKYGQCWVFAGVMCAVLRCLGIPCRVVSNFQSAHDTDKSLTIDEYYSDNGVQPKNSPDSVWNFHVWVEGWMKRPDLSRDSTYDGWQVLDPTPQERSTGVFCCGPCPVKAVLEGHTDRKYDIPFVFAEVNADQITWMLMKDGSKQRLYTDTRQIGQNISTKAVGRNEREDITASYKYPEGSKKERLVFEEAVKRGNGYKPRPEPEKPEEPSVVTLKIREESQPIMGEDIELSLILQSEQSTSRNLKVQLNAQAMRYTGVPDQQVWGEKRNVLLQPKQELKISFRIPFSLYGTKMLDNSSLKVSALVHDKQNPKEVYLAEENIILQQPTLTIQAPSPCEQFTEITAEVTFQNPLSSTLRYGVLTLTGSGLLSRPVIVRLPELPAEQRVRFRVPIIPYRAGSRKLMADFNSLTFRHIKASCDVEVKPSLPMNGPSNGILIGLD